MFPLMFVAIAAGFGTAAAIAPISVTLAVVSAPFGGSLAALATGLLLARRKGGGRQAAQPELPDQTDSMVAALRSLEHRDRAGTRSPAGKSGTDRDVA